MREIEHRNCKVTSLSPINVTEVSLRILYHLYLMVIEKKEPFRALPLRVTSPPFLSEDVDPKSKRVTSKRAKKWQKKPPKKGHNCTPELGEIKQKK
jgi:hypothetical protein